MADFKPAFLNTQGHELGWVHNAKDAGKETYNGISRRYHPNALVWQWIDKAKREPGFPKNIPHKQLEPIVEDFYKNEFWNGLLGNEMPDQKIAEWLFDIAVNGSKRRAGTFLQRTLNVLNRNQRDYPDIKVDGSIGPRTISTLTKYLSIRDSDAVLYWLAVQMGYHWLIRAEADPLQEEFTNGIGNRWVGNTKALFRDRNPNLEVFS